MVSVPDACWPVFDRVKSKVGVCPTSTVPNGCVAGASDSAAGVWPVPLSVDDALPPGAALASTVPLRSTPALGANFTVTVHDPPPASVAGQLPPETRNLFVTQWQINWDRLTMEDASRVLPDIEALRAKGPANDAVAPALLALARVLAGQKDIQDLERQVLAADSQRGHFHHALQFLAEARAQRGDAAGAVALLARAAETGLSCPVCFDEDAMLSPIRNSPQYAAFRKGLAQSDRTYRAALKEVP